MSDHDYDHDALIARIAELEQELRAKEIELAQFRLRLSATNSRLETVIDSIGKELKMAGRIQRLLSPVELPHIPGFEFSMKFVPNMKSGGDYFDIFEHQDKLRFGVVMAASSGYTMSALFLSVLLKLSARLQARKGPAPHEMIREVAAEIVPELKDESQASLFYGMIDRRNYELQYCLAGHLVGFVQSAGQDALSRIEPSTPVLRRDYAGQPTTQSISLNPKDRLILCSEGLLQAVNARGQRWGESGLTEAIRSAPRQGVHDLRNEILYRCEAFSGKTEPDRDQTVLVLEVKDKVIKLAKN